MSLGQAIVSRKVPENPTVEPRKRQQQRTWDCGLKPSFTLPFDVTTLPFFWGLLFLQKFKYANQHTRGTFALILP